MRQISYLILTICTSLALVGCVDDTIVDSKQANSPFDESDIIDTKLAVSVNDFLVSVSGTRADDKDNEEPTTDTEGMSDFEKTIDNIWVFQYDTDGNLLIKPRYYTAAQSLNSDGSWDVVLKPVESTIYVVTNVNRDTWASDYTDFMTINNGLLKQSLPFPEPITDISDEATTGHIPMQGCKTEVIPGGTGDITVEVEHMYAKVKMRVLLDNDLDAYYAYINNVSFSNIPWYCRVGTLYEGTAASKDDEYPDPSQVGDEFDWITRSFTEANNTDDPYNDQFEEGFTYDYVIYFPENIQGEVADKTKDDKDEKSTNAPEHACTMNVDIGYIDEGGVQERAVYTVYPGGNEWNNYNIRRNQVYRVTVEIGYPLYANNSPSANCIVGHPGTTITFEPYYRIEEGGGYKFSDYVNYDDPNKKIKGLRILWQTKDCIGDNSSFDKVWIVDNELEPKYSKIYVTVNQPGNAVIAAYADENCEGDIIWSWHIWVTEEDPTNIGNAIVYYTYDWDENGIYGVASEKDRVPGYGCMPCNLGALSSEPKDATDMSIFGMNYQWGRKDPFPPLIAHAESVTPTNSAQPYTEETVGPIYDNSNSNKVGLTATAVTSANELFHSLPGDSIREMTGAVDYTIKNPTVFMCGTDEAGQTGGTGFGESYVQSNANYFNNGSWMPASEDTYNLWGGTDPNDATIIYTVDETNGVHLCNDYGEKSIFDPCPYGWRVSPPDQWLGFSYTGKNPTSYDQINTPSSVSEGNLGYGMYLYIQNWKEGLTTYFPTPGPRVGNGCGMRGWTCGNYHNATVDTNYTRVNILHVHDVYNNFRIFETGNYMYYVKSVAGPIRCVREIK